MSYTNIFDAIADDHGEAADLEFRSDMMVLLRKLFEIVRQAHRGQTDFVPSTGHVGSAREGFDGF